MFASPPLSGVRVVDLTRLLPGPYATWMLSSLGADVVRVEAPGLGDYSRGFPPYVHGTSALFWVINRGKRSIGLDLKSEAGRAVLLRLVADADVLVEGFRPGVLDRLGLDEDTLRAARADLVICRITGYGQTGPLAADAGHDLNYQALAGTLWMGGHSGGDPPNPTVPTADLTGAMHAVIAIQAALLARPSAGGATLDISLSDAVASLGAPIVAGWTGSGAAAPGRGEDTLTGGVAQYRTYACKGGGHLAVGALEPKFWARFATVAGHPEWAAQMPLPGPHQPELTEQVAAAVAERTRDEWAEALAGIDCCVTIVLDPAEAAHHPHFAARGVAGAEPSGDQVAAWTELPFGAPVGGAPELGQHTDELLAELGLPAEAIAELRASGAVA